MAARVTDGGTGARLCAINRRRKNTAAAAAAAVTLKRTPRDFDPNAAGRSLARSAHRQIAETEIHSDVRARCSGRIIGRTSGQGTHININKFIKKNIIFYYYYYYHRVYSRYHHPVFVGGEERARACRKKGDWLGRRHCHCHCHHRHRRRRRPRTRVSEHQLPAGALLYRITARDDLTDRRGTQLVYRVVRYRATTTTTIDLG